MNNAGKPSGMPQAEKLRTSCRRTVGEKIKSGYAVQMSLAAGWQNERTKFYSRKRKWIVLFTGGAPFQLDNEDRFCEEYL